MATSKKLKPSYEVDDLVLHPSIIQKLKQGQLITFKRIIHLSLIELQNIGKLSILEAQETIKAISLSLLRNKNFTASDLYQNIIPRQLLHLKLLRSPDNDYCGLFTGTVTEICGESGSGKTQICLQLSLLSQLPECKGGLDTKVVYIHTEGEFPIKRFKQLAQVFIKEHPHMQVTNLTNNLFLKQVHNLNALMYVLQNGVSDLMKDSNPKLLIIDSVASVLRPDFESANLRTSTIQNFGAVIRSLADTYGIAVICVNQVSGHSKINDSTGTACLTDTPSLGLLWSNVLTTRLKISRKSSHTSQTLRVLECIYSTYHPRLSVDFFISETGIQFL